MQQFSACVKQEAVDFDDHISDAGTLARATVILCRTEWEAYQSALAASGSAAAPPGDPQDVALLAVLSERAKQSGARQRP